MKKEATAIEITETKSGGLLTNLRTWLITLLHIVIFVLNLLAFHIPLMLGRLVSMKAMDFILSYLCLIHLFNIRLTGARFTVRHHESLDEEKPVILVSNHQAMYDVPLIIWNLRKRAPKFITKKELEYWIPSISFALRNGKHLIIDRSLAKTSMKQIRSFGQESESTDRVICIFPEGTRSRNGVPKSFKLGGFATLVESMPSAQIVPVTLDGTSHVVSNNLMPVGTDGRILLEFHPALSREGKSPAELLEECESLIKHSLEERRNAA